jgi:magnesium chelatase family protein
LSEAVAALSRPWEEGMDLLEVASGRGAEILSPRTLRLSPSLSRLLGAAAAGSHHLLLLGPRGTGKTSATETLAGIWPQPPPEQQLRNRLLAELQDPYPELAATGSGPVRRVGSHASVASLIGNRSPEGWTPGEFSLAHAGLLLADELPEWHRDAREALREPLQTGRITPTRVGQRRSLPAAFALVATGNLCPCGAWPCTVGKNACRCAETERRRYRLKLSGPLLDRLDLVRVLCGEDAAGAPEIAPLTGLRAQVDRTRERLVGGYGELPGVWSDERYFRELASHPTWSGWLADTQPATLRSASKTARVAVTLAAWDGLDAPGAGHFMEAACQRPERVLADF